MKIKTVISNLASVFIILLAASPFSADETSLQNTLEKTWEDHRKACRSGKESAIKETMSAFQYGSLKNNMARMKRDLTPEMIKSMAQTDLSEMKFVDITENGPTAGLLYVMDSEERDESNKPRVIFTFIKFVKEASGWKVDGEMLIDELKYQEDGKETRFDTEALPSIFAIDGKVRNAPDQEAAADYSGILDISSYGYETQVTINGLDQKSIKDASYSGRIRGGIPKGENNINIIFIKTDKTLTSKPTVKIRIYNEQTDSETEVFNFAPKENIENRHTSTFTVN